MQPVPAKTGTPAIREDQPGSLPGMAACRVSAFRSETQMFRLVVHEGADSVLS